MKESCLSSGRQKSPAGFTLLELLLVCLLLVVITGVSTPNLQKFYRDFSLKEEVKNILYDMRFAQSRAVIENRIIVMEVRQDLSSYTFKIQESPQSSEDSAENFKLMPGRMGRNKHIKNSIEIIPEQTVLHFYPDGTIDKMQMNVCNEQSCFTLSSQEQRGYVNLSEKWKP